MINLTEELHILGGEVAIIDIKAFGSSPDTVELELSPIQESIKARDSLNSIFIHLQTLMVFINLNFLDYIKITLILQLLKQSTFGKPGSKFLQFLKQYMLLTDQILKALKLLLSHLNIRDFQEEFKKVTYLQSKH